MAISIIDKWLVAEGTDSGRWYIVHTAWPRFILEMCDDDDGGYSSSESVQIDKCLDAGLLAKLAKEAGEVFATYDRNLPGACDD